MIRVQAEDFDVGNEIARLTDGHPAIGGLCVFVGLVRDLGGEHALRRLTLEHYPGMTERSLRGIAAEAEARWRIESLGLVHRHGALAPSDRIVFVGVAARHRHAAFAACRFIIDRLKTDAPFWKCEERVDGSRRWVEAEKSTGELKAESLPVAVKRSVAR